MFCRITEHYDQGSRYGSVGEHLSSKQNILQTDLTPVQSIMPYKSIINILTWQDSHDKQVEIHYVSYFCKTKLNMTMLVHANTRQNGKVLMQTARNGFSQREGYGYSSSFLLELSDLENQTKPHTMHLFSEKK